MRRGGYLYIAVSKDGTDGSPDRLPLIKLGWSKENPERRVREHNGDNLHRPDWFPPYADRSDWGLRTSQEDENFSERFERALHRRLHEAIDTHDLEETCPSAFRGPCSIRYAAKWPVIEDEKGNGYTELYYANPWCFRCLLESVWQPDWPVLELEPH